MQRLRLMKPAQCYYQLSVQQPSNDAKPIITVHLSKPTSLVEMAEVPGFTFTISTDYKISFSIDLSSKNFTQADLHFRSAVNKSQAELVLFTRDVVEIITRYEAILREQHMLDVSKPNSSHRDYARLGNFRPEGNAF